MRETELLALKTALIAVIAQIFNLYTGAIFIALIASMTRVFYTSDICDENEECNLCCHALNFIKFFAISSGITLMLVHVGLFYGWGSHFTIIVSGMAAFMGKELLDVIYEVVPSIFRKFLISKINNDRT